MNFSGKIGAAAALLIIASGSLVIPRLTASRSRQITDRQQIPTGSDEPVPAHHQQSARGAYPSTMDPALFTEKVVFNAYAVAGRIKKVLYQQPCYCHCDRSQGHSSLLDCFVSRHGSGCEICMREAFYAFEQTRKGQAPAQIREGIIRGDWEKVDAAKYQRDYLPPTNK